MNDYIFPQAALAALIAVVGSTTSVDAQIVPDAVEMTGTFSFRQEFGPQAGTRHNWVGQVSRARASFTEPTLLATGDRERNPDFGDLGDSVNFNPLATGGVQQPPAFIESLTLSDLRMSLFDDGTRQFTALGTIIDDTGATFASQTTLVFQGVTKIDGREDSTAEMYTAADFIFSNGGNTTWILEANTSIRMAFVPAPAVVTPIMAGLVACRRRR
ncbi:MAG: hypothetical protein AAGB51_10610 [Planctomycetota bacterium]